MMNMRKTMRVLLLVLLVLALAFSVTACGCSKKKKPAKPVNYVTIMAGGASEYKVVMPKSSDYAGVSGVASSIRKLSTELGVSGMTIGNDSSAASGLEILVGDTNRSESASAMAKLAKTAGDAYFQYAVVESNGTLLLIADDSIAFTYTNYLYDYFVATYVNKETKEVKVPEGLFDVQKVTYADHEAYLAEQERLKEEQAAAERLAKIEALKKKAYDFRIADFGRVSTLPSDQYDKPEVYPTEGEHPRLLVTKETLPQVKANLLSKENETIYNKYLAYSERDINNGMLASGKMNYEVLTAIESKAFRYLITGDELYGYEAILAIKNYLVDLKPISGGDACRAYGYTMYIAALVYDWCYDLMDQSDRSDRAQIVAGVTTKLAPGFEMGFPPEGQGSISGHGTEAQLYRDWLSFAIATYDEYPSIYEFVAGRLYEEFREEPEYFMQSGAHWQGSSYGPYRYNFLLSCQILFSAMTNGEEKFFSDNLQNIAYSLITTRRPDGKVYVNGDGMGSDIVRSVSIFLASAYYGDANLKAHAREGLGGDTFSVTYLNLGLCNAFTPVLFLILNDPNLVPNEDYVEELDLVSYFGSPNGTIVARSAWNDEDAVSVYMKIGEGYTGNHEHRDAGHFMIYYKGALAIDSGMYGSKYGCGHDYTYLKQTVAHNAMLVYNPVHDNSATPNAQNKYYSGGQSMGEMGEWSSLEKWFEWRVSHQATVLGADFAVNTNGSGNTDDEYLWSYLAGDLTEAYDANTVDAYSRYMLSVMTGDPENPMAFIVFDRISSTSPTFKKTFLLHTLTAPTVNHENSTAIVVSDDGKMYVQSLLGDVTYKVIGGAKGETVDGVVNETDKHFWVGNKNYYLEDDPEYVPDEALETGWGRIEISPTAEELTSLMLTVMYVTDATNESAQIMASEIVGNGLVGAEIFGKTVLFPSSDNVLTAPVSFTTAATQGTTEYYITGLHAGLWKISINGAERSIVVKENGVLTFTGEVGAVTLTPAFSWIDFELNRGECSVSLPTYYNHGTGYTLPSPETMTLYGSEFRGWYTTPDFAEGTEIEAITATDTADFVIYAKWEKIFDVLTFELNGGKIDGEEPSRELVIGKEYVLPTSASKRNAVFVGWYLSPNYEGEALTVLPINRPEGDLTVYARFYNVYYQNDFSENNLPNRVLGSASLDNGMVTWKSPKGDANFTIVPKDGFNETTLSFSFDVDLSKTSYAMPFSVRLRAIKEGAIDTDILYFSNGILRLAGSSVTLLDKGSCDGIYRITLSMVCDNAGLAAGKAAEDGTPTTDAKYKSNIKITAYINGVYADEMTRPTFMTFGKDSYTYTTADLSNSFSSAMAKIQFTAYTKPLTASDPTSIRFDNFYLADGERSTGGDVFLSIGEYEIDPSDTSYIRNGEIVDLPKLVYYPDKGDVFYGWYLTPDFSGDPVESFWDVPKGSVLYPKLDTCARRIYYELSGGTINDESYPRNYFDDEGLDGAELPTNVTRANSTFIGWYLDPNFQQPATAIAAGTGRSVTVYARYNTVHYENDFEDGVSLPNMLYHTITFEDGMCIWGSPDGMSNFTIQPVTLPQSSDTLTFSIDLDLRKDSAVMDFSMRLRAIKEGAIDADIFYYSNGKLRLSGSSNVLLDREQCDGIYRLTIVMKCDNAGLAAGLAAAEGTKTTGNEYKSVITTSAYINGVLMDTRELSTFLTFGAGYTYSNGSNTFSSALAKMQFRATFVKAEGVPDTLGIDNLIISDGALTVGGKYFAVLNGALVDPTDTTYHENGALVQLPSLKQYPTDEFFGWYTTPDFQPESQITSLDGLPEGTIVYAHYVSHTKQIYYELKGGTINDANYPTEFVDSIGVPELPTNVTRPHHTFEGWYFDANFSKPATSIPVGTNDNVTLYARYKHDGTYGEPTLEPQTFAPTDAILNYSGKTIGQVDNTYFTQNANGTAVNAFFQHEMLKKLSTDDTLNLGISFKLKTTGDTDLPSLNLRLYPLSGGGGAAHNIINFSGSKKQVQLNQNGTYVSFCKYGDTVEHEIYIDCKIIWASDSYTGSITTAAFVDGEYVTETTSVLKITDTKNTSENAINFAGTLVSGGSDMTMENLQFHIGMPKSKPLTGKAPGGVKNVMGGSLLTMKEVGGKPAIVLEGSDSGSRVCGFFTGLSELADLRGYTGEDLAKSRFGMSFTVEGTPSADGTYPSYGIRLYRSGPINCHLLGFSSQGDISIIKSENKIASLKNGPVKIYLDVEIVWASVAGTADGYVTVGVYVDGVYLGEYGTVHSMYETKRDASETALQFYAGANIKKSEGSNIFKSVEFYFDGTVGVASAPSLHLGETEADSGLRFAYSVDKAFFDSFEGASVGALIIPTDKLPNGFSEAALADLVKGEDYYELTELDLIASGEDGYVFYATQKGLSKEQYTRSYTSIGFMDFADGRRLYTSVETCSLYEAAAEAYASGKYEGDELAAIQKYLDAVDSPVS